MSTLSIVAFWLVQASALTVFAVPFAWSLVGLWAVSHFLRAVGLTLIFHRYLAHRAFRMNRAALDDAYLTRWARTLGLADLLERARHAP